MVELAVDPLRDVGGPRPCGRRGGCRGWGVGPGRGRRCGPWGFRPRAQGGWLCPGVPVFPCTWLLGLPGPPQNVVFAATAGQKPRGHGHSREAGRDPGHHGDSLFHAARGRGARIPGPRKPSWGSKVGVCAPSSFPALGVWPIGSHLSRPSGRCLLLAGQGCSPGKPGFPRQTDRWVFPGDVLT